MKKIGFWIECIGCKTVLAMTAMLTAAFTYWAGVCTHLVNVDLENKKVRLYEDNIWANIVCLILVTAVLFLTSKWLLTKDEAVNKKRVRITAITASVAAGIIGVIWVSIHNYVPYHDQLQVVQDAMAFIEGDFSDLKGYMQIFPYQLGLAFFYEILFRIFPSYEAIYYFHVLWLMVIVYFTYAVTEELFEKTQISLYSIFLSVLFVPMYFFVNFAYGDLSVAACGVLGVWLFTKYCKTEQKKYAVLLLLTTTFNCLMRKNALIIIIAMTIALLIWSIKKLNWKMLLLAVLLVVSPICAEKALIASYEARGNVEMAEGAPFILNIAMGMQDTYEGPGYYNAYNLTTYVNSGNDAEASAEIAKQYLKVRLTEMVQNPAMTKEFFQIKTWQQWNEPSLGGELATDSFDGVPHRLVHSIYYGRLQNFLRFFRNYYMFVLYAGAFLGAVFKLFGNHKEDHIWKNVIWIVLIGGYLFSLLWESKSRYVMPYVVILMPYAAFGLCQLQVLAVKMWHIIQKRF